MEEYKALINLGELSKPATVLIEKISDAIGGIFKPYQIRRIAQAEAEANKIHAISQIEIDELQKRAMQRFFIEEAKKQKNIEAITQKALPEINKEATPEKVEDDWIVNFFDKCRLISDEDMQTLWAKILAGQANSPGKFSKRTIDLLSSLDKYDAALFTNLCSFKCSVDADFFLHVYDTRHPIYNDYKINFSSMSHLESIGLIRFDPLSGFTLRNLPQKIVVLYFDEPLLIEFQSEKENELDLGHVLLTQSGGELATICKTLPREGFMNYLKDKWTEFGYRVFKEGEQFVTI